MIRELSSCDAVFSFVASGLEVQAAKLSMEIISDKDITNFNVIFILYTSL
jgi:hypothetical protein